MFFDFDSCKLKTASLKEIKMNYTNFEESTQYNIIWN